MLLKHKIFLLLLSLVCTIGCGQPEDAFRLSTTVGSEIPRATYRYKGASESSLKWEKNFAKRYMERILYDYSLTGTLDLPDEERFFKAYNQFGKKCRLDFKIIHKYTHDDFVSFALDTYVLEKMQDIKRDPSPYKFRSQKFTFRRNISLADWRFPEGERYKRTTRNFQGMTYSLIRNRDVERNCQ